MTSAKLDIFAWVAIYLGMAAIGLGISLQRGGAGFGWAVTALGVLGIGAGVLWVWLRSRDPDRP